MHSKQLLHKLQQNNCLIPTFHCLLSTHSSNFASIPNFAVGDPPHRLLLMLLQCFMSKSSTLWILEGFHMIPLSFMYDRYWIAYLLTKFPSVINSALSKGSMSYVNITTLSSGFMNRVYQQWEILCGDCSWKWSGLTIPHSPPPTSTWRLSEIHGEGICCKRSGNILLLGSNEKGVGTIYKSWEERWGYNILKRNAAYEEK